MDNECIIPEDIGSSKGKSPKLWEASVLFTFCFFIFLTIGTRTQRWNLYGGLVITEYVLILAPALLLLLFKRYDFRNTLRLNRVSFLSIFLIFCIMLFSLPVIGILNLVNLSIIKAILGRAIVNQPIIADTVSSMLVSLVVVAISPGICEEALFRGVLQRSYEKMGVIKGILLTSFLFSLLHVDFQKILYTFILGVLIGYIVYRTNSLYAGMFAHFCNNAFGVILSFWLGRLKQVATNGPNNIMGSEFDISVFSNMPTSQLVVVVIFYLFIIGFCVSTIIAMIIALNRTTIKVERNQQKEAVLKSEKGGLLWLVPSLLFIVLLFYYQVLNLQGIENEVLKGFFKLLIGK